VFFASRVSARDARRLGTAIISHTCSRTRQLKLESYDRLFPNQDTMPKGGFGNLIALPLQKWPRESGCSVFVDADLRPYPDQWGFSRPSSPWPHTTSSRPSCGPRVASIRWTSLSSTMKTWPRPGSGRARRPEAGKGQMPKSLTVTLANLIYFEKAQLPQALANRLIRLAAFQNPEFYKAQAMRMSVWDKPRVIGNAPRTTRSTSPYLAAVSMPRWSCCGTTVSPVTCAMSASVGTHRRSPLSALCVWTRRPQLPECCITTPACCALRRPLAKRSPPLQ
jgi:hypothetical protein